MSADTLWPDLEPEQYEALMNIDLGEALDNEEEAIERGPCYPPEWYSGKLQLATHNRAGWRCEHCGAQFRPGDTRHPTLRNRDGKPLILTVHHINGRKSDNRPENLLACCQTCHLHIQAVWKPGGVLPAHWPQPPEWIVRRGLDYVPNGQLMLWER